MKEKTNLNLFKALGNLRDKKPYLAILSDITTIEMKVPEIDTACAGWDKRKNSFVIMVGESFSQLDAENLTALLDHEFQHILHGHVLDATSEENPILKNIAEDGIINEDIDLFKKKKQHALLQGGVCLHDLSKLTGKKYSVITHTSSDIYADLLLLSDKIKINLTTLDDHSKFGKNSEDAPGTEEAEKAIREARKMQKGPSNEKEEKEKGEEADTENESSGKEEGDGKDPTPSSELSEMDREMAKELLNDLIRVNQDKFMGTGSAQIDRLVKEAIKIPYNFERLFEMATSKTLRGDTTRTWKRPNRRLPNVAKGKKKSSIPKVLLLVDTSGSINDEILAKVNWQISYLAKKYDFTVIWGDTRLQGRKDVKKGEKVNINYTGFGGTDLGFYEDITSKEKFDLVIFNTDGYIPTINPKCPLKKLFCIYDGGREVPGYFNIHFNNMEDKTKTK